MLAKRHIIPIALMLGVSGLLGGCTTNPYTGQTEVSNTGLGFGLGAAGGALAGQLIGGNTASTLIGAGLGAALGGSIGAYMDNQANLLRQQLQGTGVQVIKHGNDIQLIMPSDITFAVNSSDIKPDFYNVLNSVGIVLRKFNRTIVRVTGFTDSTGNPDYNQGLSERRAQSVASYLISQGNDPRRFSVLGYGARYPVASNATAEGRARNRRVEINLQAIQ